MRALVLSLILPCALNLPMAFGGDVPTDSKPVCPQAMENAPILSAKIIQTLNPSGWSRFWQHRVLGKSQFKYTLQITDRDGTVKELALGLDSPVDILFGNDGAIRDLGNTPGVPRSADLAMGSRLVEANKSFYLYFALPQYGDLPGDWHTRYLVLTQDGEFVCFETPVSDSSKVDN